MKNTYTEWYQRNFGTSPDLGSDFFETCSTTGPDHSPHFNCTVKFTIHGDLFEGHAEGSGRKKDIYRQAWVQAVTKCPYL